MTRLDRRTLLATLGTGLAASFAGCGLFSGKSDETVELDTEQVKEALSTALPEYVMPAPVTPAPSAIEAGLDRTDELLGAVPADLTADEVPNGTIRQGIQEKREEAVRAREQLATLDGRYRRLRETRYARRDAAEAATAFLAVSGDASLEEVRDVRDTISDDVAADLQSLEYVGGDRERALYLLQRLEYDLLGASRTLDQSLRAVEPSALDVGELGGRVEYARATRAVVDHLETRHRARLADPQSFGDAFERALDRTIERASERELPERGDDPADLVETDLGDGAAPIIIRHCLRELIDVDGRLQNRLAEGRLAAGLQRAYAFERDYRACDRIRARIDDVESFDGIDPFWEARERAIRLAREASIDPDTPTLPAAMLSRLVEQIGYTDEEVKRRLERKDTVYAGDLEWLYADYVWLGEQLRALPEAVEAMAGRFDV